MDVIICRTNHCTRPGLTTWFSGSGLSRSGKARIFRVSRPCIVTAWAKGAKINDDLKVQPSNRLHALERERKGQHSISINDQWQLRNARNIYRQIGDHAKYLELRLKYMEVGTDYHDLAEFYWETKEKEKAVQIAQKKLGKATGRMVELRAFVAERAKESGDGKDGGQDNFSNED